MARPVRLPRLPRVVMTRLRTRLSVLLPAIVVIASPGVLTAQGVGLDVGTVAPTGILVEDLDGNSIDLASLVEPGQPALYEFWATWCEQCEALQPQMDRIQAEFGERISVVAVGVAVSQNPRRIRRHLERHDPGYPHVYDAAGNAVRAFNAATTALIVSVDAEGRVTYSGVGVDQDLVAEVRKVLAETAERR